MQPACEACTATHPELRPFPKCRRVAGHFGGACANCKWRDHGARCFVRDDSSDEGDKPLRLGPPPAPAGDSGPGVGAGALALETKWYFNRLGIYIYTTVSANAQKKAKLFSIIIDYRLYRPIILSIRYRLYRKPACGEAEIDEDFILRCNAQRDVEFRRWRLIDDPDSEASRDGSYASAFTDEPIKRWLGEPGVAILGNAAISGTPTFPGMDEELRNALNTVVEPHGLGIYGGMYI